MRKEKKQEIIKELVNNIQASNFMSFCLFEKIPVAEMEKLRNKLNSENIKIKVIKNKLIEKAFKQLGYDTNKVDFFNQPTFIAFTEEKEINLPQKLNQLIKDFENIKIKGGFFNGSFIDSKKVEYIASIPPKENLIMQIIQILKAPMVNLISTIQGPVVQLINVLNAISMKSK